MVIVSFSLIKTTLFNRIFKNSLLLFLGLLLILFPIALRNKIIGKEWVLISAQSGLNFYVGNNLNATGLAGSPDFANPTHKGND